MPSIEKQTVRGADGRLEDVWALPKDRSVSCEALYRALRRPPRQDQLGTTARGRRLRAEITAQTQIHLAQRRLSDRSLGRKGLLPSLHRRHPRACGPPERGRAHRAKAPGPRRVFARSLDRKAAIRIRGAYACSTEKTNRKSRCSSRNPYVTDHDEVTGDPDWSRIELWESVVPRYTGNALDGLKNRQGHAASAATSGTRAGSGPRRGFAPAALPWVGSDNCRRNSVPGLLKREQQADRF